ncbi:ABC transporter ATP-binding protein [Nesterenkonia flava]|uniref:ABC transporter ATP-binding protein n=1 Tax=Nesterenkonia flava TaxID=469799 RepID=A0ABU1FTY8_9MICC|nr:ABC transporter ATP-binding protein [Nesterenkonia flava]MDR5712122.1 ABC transporter ATP-binding protein [Nesterenkonia flava]
MSLSVDRIWKSYSTKRGVQSVLRGVDLEVRRGEFVSLIGHSGCGKSTLLNTFGGLSSVDGGRVTLDGDEITGPGPDRAMVFQNYSLLPRLSLAENVAVAVREARPDWSKQRVDDGVEKYLTAVGLWEQKDKKPSEVSGGMQQRAAVARAFAVEPTVLLADEPFGALDALTRSRLQDQLIKLWKSESDTEIVVMVTHGIDEAILLSDRIVVMGAPPNPSIIEIIEVDLPRPRDRVSIIDDQRYRAVQERMMYLLTTTPNEREKMPPKDTSVAPRQPVGAAG